PVTLGFYVFDVRDVDLKNEKFFADFYLWMRYPAPEAETETASREIEKFEFMNGRVDVREEQDRKVVRGETYVCWRMSGTFSFEARLHNYPFDTQDLGIVIEHSSLESDRLVFVDDLESYKRSGVPPAFWGTKEGLDIPEFTLRSTERTSALSEYKTDFGDPERHASKTVYSRFEYSMKFARDFWPYFFKIIIPLIVIMAMAYLVFFLPAKEIQSASGLAITALLSCIAFNITVTQNLPEVGYLVVSDKFFLCTYILLFLTLLHSVLTFAWDDQGVDMKRWDAMAVWVFPVLYIASFAYLMTQALSAG
ncbi:MAG TPA: hypothetical protein VHF22_08060, partial [Planctomycetota bacterium]|nr:hypothetical protein [Planctomycetota bacterium]